ncbi:hypothetical protein RCO28_15555 [Streptomyces sp. LHD-70]|uniref:hypothetical protein n=1 Tax=Streptomyces sp. LHD-70 TaxID=3072140 RepID=UPI00280FF1A8|nr:hypothetical protein [Streptomyces sp. LHD-70]MDQ8703898.1 hypothetical protein [Streptomyces sp. LHD-70]
MTDRTPAEPTRGPVTRDRNPLEYWARTAAAPEPERTPAPATPLPPAAAEAQQQLLEAITRAASAVDGAEPGVAEELERLARAYALVTQGRA